MEEKRIKSTNQDLSIKAVKAGIGYTIGNYLLRGLGFLTLPIFTRLLSVSDYGLYNVLLSYESVLCILISFAIHTSYKNARYKYKLISEGAESGNDYFTYISSSIILILLSVGCWIIVVNFLPVSFIRILELDRLSLNILVLYSFASAILQCFNCYAVLDYKYKTYLAVSAINAFGSIILSLILISTIFSNKRYYGRLFGTFIPIMIISIVIVVFFIKRAVPKNFGRFWKWGLGYSLPIVPHGLSQVILSQFDRIMILKMIGSAEAGIYSFAYICYSIVAITTSSLDSAWTPWFYEQMHNNNYAEIKKKSSVYIVLMFFFFSMIILVCPEIIKIFGSKDYWDASFCVIPLVAGGFFTFLYNFPAGVEYFHEKTKFIMIGTMSAAIINIILNWICIKQYGYIAAAFTTLVTYIIYFLFHFLLARKIEGRYIFSNLIILLSSIFVLVVALLSFVLLDFILIRWCIGIIEFIILVLFEEKHFSVLKKIFKRDKEK